MKTSLIIAAAVVLTGCAPITLTHPYGNHNYQRDISECQFEAAKYGNVQMWGTGVGAGIEEGLRKREITLTCMQAKGYRQQQ